MRIQFFFLPEFRFFCSKFWCFPQNSDIFLKIQIFFADFRCFFLRIQFFFLEFKFFSEISFLYNSVFFSEFGHFWLNFVFFLRNFQVCLFYFFSKFQSSVFFLPNFQLFKLRIFLLLLVKSYSFCFLSNLSLRRCHGFSCFCKLVLWFVYLIKAAYFCFVFHRKPFPCSSMELSPSVFHLFMWNASHFRSICYLKRQIVKISLLAKSAKSNKKHRFLKTIKV